MDQIEDDDELFGGVRNESEFLQKKLQVYAEYNFALDVENQPKCHSSSRTIMLKGEHHATLLLLNQGELQQ